MGGHVEVGLVLSVGVRLLEAPAVGRLQGGLYLFLDAGAFLRVGHGGDNLAHLLGAGRSEDLTGVFHADVHLLVGVAEQRFFPGRDHGLHRELPAPDIDYLADHVIAAIEEQVNCLLAYGHRARLLLLERPAARLVLELQVAHFEQVLISPDYRAVHRLPPRPRRFELLYLAAGHGDTVYFRYAFNVIRGKGAGVELARQEGFSGGYILCRDLLSGLDRDQVGAQSFYLVRYLRPYAVSNGDEGDDREDAEDHTQHGERAAKRVYSKRMNCGSEKLTERHLVSSYSTRPEPQFRQKLACVLLAAPQAGHATAARGGPSVTTAACANGAAQFRQYFAAGRFAVMQLPQAVAPPPATS